MMARQYDNDTVLHYVSNLLGMLWEHSVRLFLMRRLRGRKHVPHFNSKKCQSSHLRMLRAGWWDDACMYVYVNVCVWMCVFDWQSKRGTDDGAFLNLVWMAQKQNLLKYIGVTLSDGVLLNWQQWEINIAHFTKIVFPPCYCNNSQSILMVSVLSELLMESGGLKWTCFLKCIIASVAHWDNPP